MLVQISSKQVSRKANYILCTVQSMTVCTPYSTPGGNKREFPHLPGSHVVRSARYSVVSRFVVRPLTLFKLNGTKSVDRV